MNYWQPYESSGILYEVSKYERTLEYIPSRISSAGAPMANHVHFLVISDANMKSLGGCTQI